MDAGELGAGQDVVALYEVVPAGGRVPGTDVDKLRYQQPTGLSLTAASGELFSVRIRYKNPDEERSRLLRRELFLADQAPMSADFSFASGLALFARILRDSQYKGEGNLDRVEQLLAAGTGKGQEYRRRMEETVARARILIEARR